LAWIKLGFLYRVPDERRSGRLEMLGRDAFLTKLLLCGLHCDGYI
jgi:hypothetical protein